MIDNSKEYILCAAIKRKFPNPCQPYYEGTNDICNIEIGYRHHDIYQRFDYVNEEDCPLSFNPYDQGFYTSKGRYVDRYEGMEIAYNAGQVNEEVALSKAWHNIKINCVNEPDTDWDKKDTHKFNMLCSENLY